jgi:phosphoribosylformylglycinamidine synthase
VAVLREEGSNSDREMAAVLHMAGFEVWDVNMEDLCQERLSLDQFRGLVFVGGFSYADVCGSAKGSELHLLYSLFQMYKSTAISNTSCALYSLKKLLRKAEL